jgi:hypothetical protein
MESLLIKIDSPLHVKYLTAFLKTIPYIKSVEKTKILTDADWVLSSNRPATDKEIEELCAEMEKETGGVTSDLLLSKGKKNLEKCLGKIKK